MHSSRARPCRAFLGTFLTMLVAHGVAAQDKYVKSKDPLFPEAQPDRALVYFARTAFQRLIPLSTFKVFVDAAPGAWLPQRSYVAVQVEPGRRLIWGPPRSDPQWFEFNAGKTYLFLLVESYGPNNIHYGSSWRTGDPADVQFLVQREKLKHVNPTEHGMAELREEAAKEYAKVVASAPKAISIVVPQTFETVWYRPGKRGFSFKAYEATGTLAVRTETIEFKSDKKTIVIPVKDIQSLSLDKMTKDPFKVDPNEWAIIKYGPPGALQVVGFRDGRGMGWGGDTGKIYMTLKSTLQTTPLSPPPSGAAGVLPEEQVVVNFDDRPWQVGYSVEERGQRIKEFVLPGETVDNWAELVTVQSFPGAANRMTAKEVMLGMKQQLNNECPKAMWSVIREGEAESLYEWQTVDCLGWDNQYEVSKVIRGQAAIHRVAYANRKLPILEETRRQWIDLIGKVSYQDTLPEGFVRYEELRDQFTLAIPKGWGAYDQSAALKGAAGLYGIVLFLPSDVADELKRSREIHIEGAKPSDAELKEIARKAMEPFAKVDTGEITSFMVERVRAESGMSCTGFSAKAEEKLLKNIGRDAIFEKKNVSEPLHADPATVAGCRGLRIQGRGRTTTGAESVVDILASSDGETLYLFVLRPLAENYAKNLPIFERAVSTARLAKAN